MYDFVNKYVFNLFLKTTRERAVYGDRQGIIQQGMLPSEMTCHLDILVMSGALATGVDLYTLIAWVQFFSETGTELDIIEPWYEEPCMSSTTP